MFLHLGVNETRKLALVEAKYLIQPRIHALVAMGIFILRTGLLS
jgi:hypothetical protein